MKRSRLSCIALALLLSLVVAALPNTASAKGEKEHQEIVDSGQVYDDPELQAYVNRVGQALATNSGKPKQKFTFTVLDTEMINAFAAPGGYIYISRGILPYLENEEELAGVLGHEIAHVTAGHHFERGSANVTSKVLSTLAYILTGSGDIADASTMYGAELISGYGREQELEADGLGAEYMHKTGYDPQALLQVIGVLKDQEQFARFKAGGKSTGSYHGLYASHPRNDKRLQTVIRAAGELELDHYVESPERPGEFRQHIEGLVWGESVQGLQEENRYYHNKLAFTFEHPPGWTVQAGGKAVIVSAPDNSASVEITLRRRDGNTAPKEVLESAASGSLSDGRELEQAGLQGYSAIASAGGISRRLAVIDYNYTYLFQGKANDLAAQDAALLSIIESFRPMLPQEKQNNKPTYVHYIQVPRGATMASLAAGLRIPHAEQQLRLLNGMYPRGEPRTGDWIKTIRQLP
jgi:predicted Zn-dependent protease